ASRISLRPLCDQPGSFDPHRALLEPEHALAESGRFDRARHLLAREVAQPRLQARQAIAKAGRLARARDLILADLEHAVLRPREPPAHRADLAKLAARLAREVRQAALDPIETLAEIVGVRRLRLRRRLGLQRARAALDVLEASDQLLDASLHGGRSLDRV